MSPRILLVLLLAPASLLASSHDNDVEWFGVFSYPGYRIPAFPSHGQSFIVDLRVYKGDITGARVRVWDGSERFYSMSWNRNEGPYDIYRSVSIPAGASYLYYYFEITDGTKTDYYNAQGMWADPPPRGDFFVDTTPSGKYSLGATLAAGGVVFRVWAPNATSAAVAGTFNGFSTTQSPLTSTQGFWEALVPGASPGQEYKFVFNGGSAWRTDPYARRQKNSVGNSRSTTAFEGRSRGSGSPLNLKRNLVEGSRDLAALES